MPIALSILAAATLAAAPATHVTTGAATSVTSTAARVAGTISHPEADTTYHFEYGTDTTYGSSTPSAPAPGSGGGVRVQLTHLQPATTYHYRLVAQSSASTTAGDDRTFATPFALRLQRSSHVLSYGAPALLSGKVPNPGVQIALQSRPAGSGATFAQVGPAGVTAADGSFGFRVPSLTANTEFRAVTSDDPPQTSNSVSALVAPIISTRVRPGRPRAGAAVRFSGTIRPERDGARFALQKRSRHGWVTVAGGIAHHAPGGVSTWGKTLVLRRGGSYRVFVRAKDGRLTSGTGAVKHVRLAHR